MQEKTITCFHCGESWNFPPPLSRRAECPGCRRDAKVCRNCQFFDPGAHHECRESQAEWVKEKEAGNFCGYFEPSLGKGNQNGGLGKAKSDLAALFGGPQGQPEKQEGASLADELAQFLGSKKN